MPYLTVHCNASLRNKNTAEFLNAATELVAGELKNRNPMLSSSWTATREWRLAEIPPDGAP